MLAISLRIKLAKWLDEYLGRVLIALVAGWRLGWREANEPMAPQRILIIKFWGLGSIILLEPALRHLRERFPHARIDFLTLAQNREVFVLLPHVDRVHVLEFERPLNFLASILPLLMRLQRQRYDLIFDAEFFANFSALLARSVAPQSLVGFARPNGRKRALLDIAVPFHDGEHAAQNFLRLISVASNMQQYGFVNSALFPRLHLQTPTRSRAGEAYVVMNVNASALALERRWPQKNFVQLANWLLQQYDARLVLIGNHAEKAYTQQVAEAIAMPERIDNLAGALSLRALANLIQGAALFISNDSGPLHLAAALQRPVVGFYGPETPARFGPLCERRIIFYLGLSCSPCMSVDNAKTVNCTNHLRCMRELRVLDLLPAVQRFITQHQLLPLRMLKAPALRATQGVLHDAY